ncbi:MAG: helix-turn-helix transcriptional regulator [Oscillospiraceae bacterium]|nr:helix-turn-helix transcriptional regulator [Oscillospiraceae bacterium]
MELKQPECLYGVISALLFRSSEMGNDIAEELSSLGIDLPDKPFRVAYFSLDDDRLQSLSGKDRHNCRLNMYDALRDTLIRFSPEDSYSIHVLLLGQLISVFYDEETDLFVDICKEAVAHAEKELDFSAHASISTQQNSVENVDAACRLVRDFENSRTFYADFVGQVFDIPADAMIRMVDHDQRTRFEQTFFQTAEHVCGSVRAKDCELVTQYLREQLLKIAENCLGMPYPTTLNLTINRFVSLLQYRLAEQELADWRYLAQMDFSRDLISCANLEQYLDHSRVIAEALVEHYCKRTANQHDKLMHSIYDFVEQNATDVNMGLSVVAREFKIKPREAAESFRQYFGESVNDVMHRARVRQAKEMLLTTDMPVQEIAEAVGYCSLATMYRAFTKLEGVAPGKLRQGKGIG